MEYPNHHITEFRIVLPLTVEQYHVGQLWSVAETSKNQTGGGEGVEILVNEPFDETKNKPPSELLCNGRKFTQGQYSRKIYHMFSKVPQWLRPFIPTNSMEFEENSWNAYPYTKTVITNPKYMKENFYVIIETFHAPDNGHTHNIHQLKGSDLKNRKIVMIDVANDKVSPRDYVAEYDPCLVPCPKADRAPLPRDGTGKWMNTIQPAMCCYKLVKIWFKWFGLQKKVESYMMSQEHRLFFLFHRQVVCWQNNYHNLTMEDVRRIEVEVTKELERKRKEDSQRGFGLDE